MARTTLYVETPSEAAPKNSCDSLRATKDICLVFAHRGYKCRGQSGLKQMALPKLELFKSFLSFSAMTTLMAWAIFSRKEKKNKIILFLRTVKKKKRNKKSNIDFPYQTNFY